MLAKLLRLAREMKTLEAASTVYVNLDPCGTKRYCRGAVSPQCLVSWEAVRSRPPGFTAEDVTLRLASSSIRDRYELQFPYNGHDRYRGNASTDGYVSIQFKLAPRTSSMRPRHSPSPRRRDVYLYQEKGHELMRAGRETEFVSDTKSFKQSFEPIGGLPSKPRDCTGTPPTPVSSVTWI